MCPMTGARRTVGSVADPEILRGANGSSASTSSIEGKTTEILEENLKLLAEVDIDIGADIKTLTNKSVMQVAKVLYEDSPLSSSEIGERAGLTPRACTYAIGELRHSSMVKVEGRKYYLTNYAVALIAGLSNLRNDLRKYSKSIGVELFAPSTGRT